MTASVIRFTLNPAPDFANAMTTESASSPSAPAAAKTAGAEAGAISPAQAKLVLDVTRMLAVTTDLCRNVLLADVPAIVGSIDIVMGEVDR